MVATDATYGLSNDDAYDTMGLMANDPLTTVVGEEGAVNALQIVVDAANVVSNTDVEKRLRIASWKVSGERGRV